MSGPQIYLASTSPRRRELLAQLGIRFELVSQDIPEIKEGHETPEQYVERLALAKAHAGLEVLGKGASAPVLGADTAVVVDNQVLGKPRDEQDALAMLERLSGRSHRVLSAVAVVARVDLGQDRHLVKASESHVVFRSTTADERKAYWLSGEPADKAGAYGIQGLAAVFIERLEGSYSGVMGLPLYETAELLRQFGIEIFN